jgi:cytidine deaminase
MDTFELTDDDRRLIEAAKEATKAGFRHGHHYVGCALRTADGAVYTGLNVETNIGRAAVCAEPVAIGAAVSDGVHDLDTIVAVRHPAPGEDGEPFLVSPCGVCREMITDFGHDVLVIFSDENDQPRKARAIDLLPNKYIRSYRDEHVG